MQAPAISVVVIVHNSAPWLKACLDSLRGQSFQQFEVIAVDVASDLATKRVLWRNLRSIGRSRLLTAVRNVGGARAGNWGLRRARGKYVFLMDSDDIVPPHALRHLFDAAERNGHDVTIGRALSIEGEQLCPIRYTPDTLTWARPVTVTSLRERPELTVAPYYWGRLYRRDLLEDHAIRMKPGRLFADRYFTCKALLSSVSIGVIPELSYIWRRDHKTARGQTSITQRSGQMSSVVDRIASFAEVESLFSDPADAQVARYVRLTNLMRLLIHAKRAGGDATAMKQFVAVCAEYARSFTEEEVANCDFLLRRHKVQWYLLGQGRSEDLAQYVDEASTEDPDDLERVPKDVPASLRVEAAHDVGPGLVRISRRDGVQIAEVTIVVPGGGAIEPLALVRRRSRLDREDRVFVESATLCEDRLTFEVPVPDGFVSPRLKLSFECVRNGRFRRISLSPSATEA